MMIIFKSGVTNQYTNDKGVEMDFDSYELESQSQISTKYVNVNIDFKEKTISGDFVGFGGWYDLMDDDLKFYFDYLKEEKLLVRDIDFKDLTCIEE